MKESVVAIVGPMLSSATVGTQIACSKLNMPQIAPIASEAYLANNPNYNYLLRMLPISTVESLAITAFIEHNGWSKVAILASNTDFGMQSFIIKYSGRIENKRKRLKLIL